MKVKCIKTAISTEDKSVVNSDLDGYLVKGKDYIVYGISASTKVIYYMIFDDRHLLEVPAGLFEIIDGEISMPWVAKAKGENEIKLWPELFYQDNFLESFSDWDEGARSSFSKLKLDFE